MERTIDQIKQAEHAMQQLLKVAAQLRREVENAGARNPEQLKDLMNAAEKFEKEAQKIKDYLKQWRQSIH